MNTAMIRIALSIIIPLLLAESLTLNANAQSNSNPAKKNVSQSTEGHDGRYDFDFSMGTWKTELSLLVDPLTGSAEWVEYEGTSIVRQIWGGRANLVELLDASNPAGRRIEGLNLRLYNPQSRQWSLNYSNVNSGVMSTPVTGEFRNGRGEFYSQETFNGRAILVKFVISKITPDSWRYEQSFSDDGGKTWEANWIATDTLIASEN